MAPQGDATAADTASRTLVLGVDAGRRVVQCGPNAASVLGRAPAEVIGCSAAELVVDEAKADLEVLLEGLAAGQERSGALTLRRADGTTTEVFWLHVTPGGVRESPAHGPGVVEHILVASGHLVAGRVGEERSAGPGESIEWISDVSHTYRSDDGALAVLTIRSPSR